MRAPFGIKKNKPLHNQIKSYCILRRRGRIKQPAMALALVYLLKKSDLCFGVGEGVCIRARRRDAHSIRRRDARTAASDSAVKLILLACLEICPLSAAVTLIETAKELPRWQICIFFYHSSSFLHLHLRVNVSPWPITFNHPWTWNLCIGGLLVQLLHPALPLIPLSAASNCRGFAAHTASHK